MEMIGSWLIRRDRLRDSLSGASRPPGRNFLCQAVEVDINNGRGIQREHLAEQQTPYHRDAERTPQLGPDSRAQRERETSEQSSHGGHHDGTETQQASLVDRLLGAFAFLAFRFQREIDHHNAVLFHDPNEQDNSYQRNDAQFGSANQESQNRANARGRQRGKNRERMNIALVKNAQHDVNGYERRQNQYRLRAQRRLERCRGALKRGLNTEGHSDFLLGFFDRFGRFT